MNHNCLLLLKSQLQNELRGKDKSKGRTVTLAAMCVVVIIVIAYAFFLSYGLSSIGMASAVPGYAVTITSLIMLFFTVFKANGVLFAYKEYDFLMALPVKTSTVIASRFLTMYIMNTLLTAVVMLPMGIGYVIWQAPGPLFYLEWIIGIFAVPLFPTTLASLLGALIILFSSRFRYANAVVTVASIAFIIGILLLSFSAGSMDSSTFDTLNIQAMSSMLMEQIHRIYPPAALFYAGIVRNQALPLLAYFLGSLVWYYLFIRLVSLVYKKLNTALTTFHARSDYKLTELKSSSVMAALLKKEWKRFLSSTIYCINMGMGALMTVLAAGVLLFVPTETINQVFQSPKAWDLLLGVLPFAVGAMLSMTCTTAVSLSLEGKNLWIIKSLPIEDVTIMKSKILMNLTLQLPAGLIAALLLNIRFPLSPVMRLLMFLTPFAYSFFNSLWGMLVNIKMPDYDWTSETALVKQSLPAMAGMFGGLLGGVIPIGAVLLLRHLNAELTGCLITLLIAAGALLLWLYIRRQKIPV